MKIEIGSGEHPNLDYDLHIDIRPGLPHLEKCTDGSNLSFLKDASVTEIAAKDVLEHFSHRQVRRVLKEWLRVLVPGGIIHLVTPNFRNMAERYLGLTNGQMEPNDALNWSFWILGGQDYYDSDWIYNAHYTLFDTDSWVRLSEEVGFDILRLDDDGGSNLIIDIEKRP